MMWSPFKQRTREPVFVEVIFVDWDWPESDVAEMDLSTLDDLLEAALRKDNLGVWTGHGQYLNECRVNFDFDIPLPKLKQGVECLRKELIRIHVRSRRSSRRASRTGVSTRCSARLAAGARTSSNQHFKRAWGAASLNK